MNKTAKIERLTASDGPVWTSQQGVPYYGVQLWMDNGDQGDALVKTPTELTVGQELTYQNETTQYGERIKIDWAAMRGGRPCRTACLRAWPTTRSLLLPPSSSNGWTATRDPGAVGQPGAGLRLPAGGRHTGPLVYLP
jgi:hypothetical protein